MNKYVLRKPFKTRFLNLFRRIFKLGKIEGLIVRKTISSLSSPIWSRLVPPSYLYRKNSFRRVTRDNVNYHLDISNFVDHSIFYGIKDMDFSPVVKKIKQAKVIFDIGANIGFTATFFAKNNPSAAIFAFEPHPKTYKRALENLALNNFSNIYFQNLGLGDEKKRLKLFEVNDHNPGMNRIMDGDQNFPSVEIVLSTIDQFFEEKNLERVDFMKIDVEGYEYAVLKGGKKTFSKFQPALFIELDDNNLKENHSSAAELVSLLQLFNYKTILRTDNLQEVSGSTDFTNCHYDIVAF